jgi:hypothetical protein
MLPTVTLSIMTLPLQTSASTTRANPLLASVGRLGLLTTALLLIAATTPAFAQRCTTQNGQTICCDNSGNCYSR